jgi:hypothetical protein
VHWTDRLAHVALAAVALLLLVFLAAPLAAILLKSVQDNNDQWVGFRNFVEYARTPALLQSLWNSLWVSALVTAITVPAAFGFAYALTRSRMGFKRPLRGITLIPLLAPSLLSAISLIYWFGNQGVLKSWLDFVGIEQIYGAPGIVMAEIFCAVPACADDPGDRAHRRRRAPVRGRRRDGHQRRAQVLDDHAAGRQVRADLARRWWCSRWSSPTSASPRSSAATSTCWPPTCSSWSSASRTSRRARWWRCCCWRRRC